MKIKNGKIILLFGIVSCLLAGCGSVIPELTEEETALIATYAADVVLGNSREKFSRLIDTEAETTRLNELAEKVQELKKTQAQEINAGETGAGENGQSGQSGDSAGSGTAGETAAQMFLPEDMATIIGLDGFAISYGGCEIAKSYAADEATGFEFAIDASEGKNLLIAKFQVTNTGTDTAMLDMMSKNMLFSFSGDYGISGMALMTMLLDDFAYAKDEIAAGASKQYVLITQVNENITEVGKLSLRMKTKNSGNSVVVTLQ